MRFRYGRRSLCVSSQSGCPLTCTFCATGQMKFGRNLTRWELQLLRTPDRARARSTILAELGQFRDAYRKPSPN